MRPPRWATLSVATTWSSTGWQRTPSACSPFERRWARVSRWDRRPPSNGPGQGSDPPADQGRNEDEHEGDAGDGICRRRWEGGRQRGELRDDGVKDESGAGTGQRMEGSRPDRVVGRELVGGEKRLRTGEDAPADDPNQHGRRDGRR